MAPCEDDTVASVSDVAAERSAAPLTHFLAVLPARDKESEGGGVLGKGNLQIRVGMWLSVDEICSWGLSHSPLSVL